MSTPICDLLETLRKPWIGKTLNLRQNSGEMETVGRIAEANVLFGKLEIRTTESKFRIGTQAFQPISIYTPGQNLLRWWVNDIDELKTEADGTISLNLLGGDVLLIQP